MRAFRWIVAILGCVILLTTMVTGGSAPQEAAGGAVAVACGALPYFFTRAVEGLSDGRYTAMAQALTALKSIDQKLRATEKAATLN